MSNNDDDLFGNDSDEEESLSKERENIEDNNQFEMSEIDENEKFGEEDYFGYLNEEFSNSSAFPKVKCPGEKILENYDRGFKKPKQKTQETTSYFQFKPTNEKLISLENKEFERETMDTLDTNINADFILNNYLISYTLRFDPSLNKYDNFSKKHHRDKLYKLINEIDWDNEYKIKMVKKEVNPYQDIFENYFHRCSSYKIANLNSLFKFNLFNVDYLMGYTPIMVIGDDGGFADYFMWQANNNSFTTKIFSVPEKNSKIFKTEFRKEIDEMKDNYLNIIDLEKGRDLDEIEDFNSESISTLANEVLENTDGFGVSFFIAKKFIRFKKEFNQELKYKKFLLLNVILGLSVLSKGGNFAIKIYDMYTHFTVSVLFLLYNYFEKFTIIKPFSIRPHTSSRYVVCQKLTESKPPILDFLFKLYDNYIDLLKEGKDIEFVYPISKIIKQDTFTNYIMELNSLMTEQRIETLEEMKSAFEGQTATKFDKMDLKKKCLDLWKVPVLHYDPRQVILGKNAENINDKKGQNKGIAKINSIQETVKLYNDYDKYSDSLQSMINMLGEKKDKKESVVKPKSELRSSDHVKPDLTYLTSKSKSKKPSSLAKFEQLKESIRSERDSGNRVNISNALTGTNFQQEEFLKKKRELLISNVEKNSSSNKKNSDSKKKTIKMPSNSKIKFETDNAEEIKEIKKANEVSFKSSREIIKRKEQAIQESMKNRKIAENKKVVLNEELLKELEKVKKK